MGGKADRLAVDLGGLEDFAHNLDSVRSTMNGRRELGCCFTGGAAGSGRPPGLAAR